MILKTIVSSSLEKSQVELIFHPAIKNLFNYLFQLVSSAIMKNMRTTSFCHRNWSQFRKLCIWDLLCSRLQLLQAFVGNDDNTHKRVETQGEITCWTLGSLTKILHFYPSRPQCETKPKIYHSDINERQRFILFWKTSQLIARTEHIIHIIAQILILIRTVYLRETF